MIYKLQKKFILICTISVLAVITLVFGVTLALNISSMNKNMDLLTEKISAGGGLFPGATEPKPRPDRATPPKKQTTDFITSETPFSTRHFTVFFDKNGAVTHTNTASIYSVTDEAAIGYAKGVLEGERTRGWVSYYRYRVFSTEQGSGVVFVDGSVSRSSLAQSMTIAGLVLLGCAALVLLLIVLLSRRAVKPIAESYEKQKQFVTDANHELKTPLTLILANLDIAEAELGKNEWLDDIRAEGHRMTELVNQLVALSRMDEEKPSSGSVKVAFGALVGDLVAEFEALAGERGKTLTASIARDAVCRGDEALLHRLVGVLLDNAVKYCDSDGEIRVTLCRGRRIVLTVENTYAAVGELELERLFDRFYRADKARRFTGGFGIGLSMARAIAAQHKGEITAYQKTDTQIGFKVVLPSSDQGAACV